MILLLTWHVGNVIDEHGGLRSAAKALDIDPGYLSRLASGEKDNPSKETLDLLGIERKVAVSYMRKK